LAREIDQDRRALDLLDARHEACVRSAARTGEWNRLAPALKDLARRYREAAAALRQKQDRFNIEAPSIALERPGIWVDHLVGRLAARLREAGAPDDLCAVTTDE
ncbi:MAG: hypothetical protein M0R74_02480, partial [Dehalococcoidia bacterium]|nr:hypothetical protein [Dehalococcoidia bacterium]